MNKLFVEDLIENIEVELNTEIEVMNQSNLKELILEHATGHDMDCFPMLAMEETNDSSEWVDFNESKFLNDKDYDCTWLVGKQDNDITFILGLSSHNDTLVIEAFEVNVTLRGFGTGSNVLSSIEYIAEKYFDQIELSPFDTDAMNFWEHMEYEMNKYGKYIKQLEREDY